MFLVTIGILDFIGKVFNKELSIIEIILGCIFLFIAKKTIDRSIRAKNGKS